LVKSLSVVRMFVTEYLNDDATPQRLFMILDCIF
jgi:hypothetical protein